MTDDSTGQIGGVLLADFLKDSAVLEQDDFCKQHPSPVLLLEPISDNQEDLDTGNFATLKLQDPSDSATRRQSSQNFSEQLRQTFPTQYVVKVNKQGSAFSSIITLGRTPKSDVFINLASVSKFHCYFTHNSRNDTWHISDANASNGTFLDGERLKANVKIPLQDGAGIRFGHHVRGRFFRAKAFFEYLQTLKKTLNISESD